jgi:hypothetical protein
VSDHDGMERVKDVQAYANIRGVLNFFQSIRAALMNHDVTLA